MFFSRFHTTTHRFAESLSNSFLSHYPSWSYFHVHSFMYLYLIISMSIFNVCTLCKYMIKCIFVRFGIGRFTTEAEVDFAIKKCVENTLKLREMRYFFSAKFLVSHGRRSLKRVFKPRETLHHGVVLLPSTLLKTHVGIVVLCVLSPLFSVSQVMLYPPVCSH